MSQFLDQLLEELHQQGTFDSSDSFDVDLARAQAKQLTFQLADPGFYLLKILQAAVCCGATEARVNLTREEVKVVCPGPADLQHVLSEHLAVGMRAAQAQKPAELWWRSWTGHEGARFDGELNTGPSPNPGFDGHGFYLKRHFDLLKLFASTTPQLMAEHRAVSRAPHYPVPLVLDGRVMNGDDPESSAQLVSLAQQKVHPRALLAERYLLSSDPLVSLPLRPAESMLSEAGSRVESVSIRDMLFFRRPRSFLNQFLRCDERQPWFGHDPRGLSLDGMNPTPATRCPGLPGRLACRVRLSIPFTLSGPGTVQIVKDGVDLVPFETELGCPGARVLLSLRVATDLSQFAVVQNDALERLLNYLRAHFKSMVHDLLYYLPRLQRFSPELATYVAERLR